jgi:hypothetical protein
VGVPRRPREVDPRERDFELVAIGALVISVVEIDAHTALERDAHPPLAFVPSSTRRAADRTIGAQSNPLHAGARYPRASARASFRERAAHV